MFKEQYAQLVTLAGELEQFRGYLDTEEQKVQREVQGRYDQTRNHLAYDLVNKLGDTDAALAQATAELNDLAAAEPGWSETIAGVRDDLLERIGLDRNKSPIVKRLARYALPITIALAATIYFGLWQYESLTIDALIDTKAGLMQRAQAFDKAAFYQDMAGGPSARNGLVKDILFAPFEPDEDELKGASAFAGLVLAAGSRLERDGHACTQLGSVGNELSKAEIEFVSAVSADVTDAQTPWGPSAIDTLVELSAKHRTCR
jgi:hypothetical protein